MGKNPVADSGFCCFLGFILLAMGVTKTVMGIKYFHDCDLEPNIPIFLIVGGITSVLIGVFNCLSCGFKENSKSISCGITVFSVILAIFGIIWLIIGFTFVFPKGEKIRVPKCNPDHQKCMTCNNVLLDFTIGIVIVEVICLAAIVVGIYYLSRCK